MISRRQLTHMLEVSGALPRDPVAPALGVGGEPAPASFIQTCYTKRAGPYDQWLRYDERCTGKVPWNLPGRPAELPPALAAGLGLAIGLIPGGQLIGLGLGLAGVGGSIGMNGGFESVPLGGGFGLGGVACPKGTYCRGVPIQTPIGSTCLGSCVPYTAGDLPGVPGTPGIGPIYEDGTGAVVRAAVGRKRKRMNYANQKALRRALRRATGYARQQKAIRKVAGEFAREFGPRRSRPRRDLPRGHVHVR